MANNKFKYKLTVEFNTDPAYHPITVNLKGTDLDQDFSGKTVKACLIRAIEILQYDLDGTRALKRISGEYR